MDEPVDSNHIRIYIKKYEQDNQISDYGKYDW